MDCKKTNPGTLNHSCIKVFTWFWESGRYDIDTDKILLHFNILPQQNIIFSQNPPITQELQNDVLHGNMNMDASLKSGILSYTKFLSKYSTHLWKSDKTEGATERCSVRIAVPDFRKYRVITYGFRKILAQYSKLTCFVVLGSSFFRS